MRTVQDKEVDIRRLEEMVVDKWEKEMAVYEGKMKCGSKLQKWRE